MKRTTIELPEPLFRKAKSKAVERGQTLNQFVTEAVQEKLAAWSSSSVSVEPEWMRGFGKLRRLRRESVRIRAKIEKEFEVIEPKDRL